MSQYTYFKPKENSAYSDPVKNRNRRTQYAQSPKDTYTARNEIVLNVIKWYDDNSTTISKMLLDVTFRLKMIKMDIYLEAEDQILGEIEEHGAYGINHAMSEYDMEELVRSSEKWISDTATRILALSIIRFKKEDEYSDTPQNTMEYLRDQIPFDVNSILDNFEEDAWDYVRSEILTKGFDRIENQITLASLTESSSTCGLMVAENGVSIHEEQPEENTENEENINDED